jgi:hypothetical protein
MITLTWECPDIHKPFTAQRKITFEIKDEASLDEMLEAYTDFLKGMGYQIPENSCLLFDPIDVEYNNNVTPLRGNDV